MARRSARSQCEDGASERVDRPHYTTPQRPENSALRRSEAVHFNGEKEQYRRAVVSKALAYALGRYLDFRDRPAVDAICNTLEKNEDSFQTLLEQIVLSEPF